MSLHTQTLIFVISFLFGIVCGESSGFASEIAVGVLVLSILQSALYLTEKYFGKKRKQVRGALETPHLFSFIAVLISSGIFFGIIRIQLVKEGLVYECPSSCTYEAEVISSPEVEGEYQVMKVRPLPSNDIIFDVQVRTTLYPKYTIGDILLLQGKVTPPSIVMPHTITDTTSRSFDYSSYLRTKNIGSEMFYPHVEVVTKETVTFSSMLGRWKEDMIERINVYVLQPASSLASGMLFGSSSFSKEMLQTFRVSGLSHIVVLSGFNIVIVISSILYILSFLPFVLRIFFASTSVIFFVIMVGASPSVLRATLMAFISLTALLLGRMYVARQALALSLFAIVMYEPHSLTYDVSLHLSFLATMGIVYLSETLSLVIKKYWRHTFSREIFVTTLAAYLATLPYVMYVFGKVSVYALLANIIVVPLIPASMLLSFLVVVSSYVSEPVTLVAGFIDSYLIGGIIWFARMIESLPLSYLSVTISKSVMCILYLLLFMSVKYIYVSHINETRDTKENQNLTGIISY